MSYSSGSTATLAVHNHETYTDGLNDGVLERYEDDDVYHLPERDPDQAYWEIEDEVDGEHMDNLKGFLSPGDAQEVVESYDTVRLTGAFFDECVRNTFTSIYEAYRLTETDELDVEIVSDGVVWQTFDDAKYTLDDLIETGGKKRAMSIMGQYAEAMASGEEDADHIYETTQRTKGAIDGASATETQEMLAEFTTALGEPADGFSLSIV